jgi:outer membrane lipoprotein-sorting protein
MATVRYVASNTSYAYMTKQQAKSTGEYRIEVTEPKEVAGNITLSDGKTICQYNSNNPNRIATATTEAPERSELFFTSFVKNYQNARDVTIQTSKQGARDVTTLEAVIPGTHPYLAKEKMMFDNASLKPLELVIYDGEGRERIIITYSSITYNVPLSDDLFKSPVAK